MLRILITRAQAAPMAALIRDRGGVPVHVPLLALTPTGTPPPPGRPDLVLITSAFTAAAVPRLAAVLGGAAVVAVGKKTAAALQAQGVAVTAVGTSGGAEAVALLGERWVPGASVWSIGAAALSPQLSAALRSAPWSSVHWPVYDNRTPPGAAEALAAALPVDVITFASGSAARAFASMAQPGSARIAVIGPSTAEDVRGVGLPVATIASRPGLEALVEAAISLGRAG